MVPIGMNPVEFELPIPKTRKEYFMAIAAGGVPGTDFPERLDTPDKIVENLASYEESLEHVGTTSNPYVYAAEISNFIGPMPDYSDIADWTVTIDGKSAEWNSTEYKWETSTGYRLYKDGRSNNWVIRIEVAFPREFSRPIIIMTSHKMLEPGIPIQPSTIEEAYWARVAKLDVVKTFIPKSRKDKYLNALINK